MDKRYVLIGYCLLGLLVATLSYLVMYVRLAGGHRLTAVETYFVMPGALLIGPFFPGPHSGPEFFPGVVVANTLAYSASAFCISRLVRPVPFLKVNWDALRCIGLLLALWVALAYLRGPNCAWEWWVAEEGLLVTITAWFAAGLAVLRWAKRWTAIDRPELNRRMRSVHFGVAVVLMLIWGLTGIAFCRLRG